jgi:hypothetical protein
MANARRSGERRPQIANVERSLERTVDFERGAFVKQTPPQADSMRDGMGRPRCRAALVDAAARASDSAPRVSD